MKWPRVRIVRFGSRKRRNRGFLSSSQYFVTFVFEPALLYHLEIHVYVWSCHLFNVDSPSACCVFCKVQYILNGSFVHNATVHRDIWVVQYTEQVLWFCKLYSLLLLLLLVNANLWAGCLPCHHTWVICLCYRSIHIILRCDSISF